MPQLPYPTYQQIGYIVASLPHNGAVTTNVEVFAHASEARPRLDTPEGYAYDLMYSTPRRLKLC